VIDDPAAAPAPDAGEDTASVGAPTPGKTARRRLFDVGVVTAVIALAFSAMTYWIDRQGQDRADDRQARAELTDMVGKMAALPREYRLFDGSNAAADPNAVSSNFNSELLVLVAQAERLVDEHPSIASPADWLSIGFAHFTLSNYEQAVDAFQAARTKVVSRSDERVAMASMMNEAAALFGLDRTDDGRTMFERAIARARTDGRSQLQIDYDVDFIRRRWAQIEMSTGNCLNALRQIDRMALQGDHDLAFAEYQRICMAAGPLPASS